MRLIKYIDGTHDNSILVRIFLLPLLIISFLYWLIIKIRVFLYDTGFMKKQKLPCFVISVGNITVGGSGKTPMAIYLSRKLIEKGLRTAVISRGYKGKNTGSGIVSDGQSILMTSEEAGDEPFLIASKVKNCPVIVGIDRYKAGLLAIERFKPDIIILDDGFQHIKLERDKDIVLIDSIRVFGSGYLLPGGILREPISSLKRATHILISGTKSEISLQPRDRYLKPPIDALGGRDIGVCFSQKPYFFKYTPIYLINLTDNSVLALDKIKGKDVLAFTGIANPASFLITLQGIGAVIKDTFIFNDHHRYTIKDLEHIKKAQCSDACIITTEKDGVKIRDILPSDMDVYVLAVDIVIDNEQEFLQEIC